MPGIRRLGGSSTLIRTSVVMDGWTVGWIGERKEWVEMRRRAVAALQEWMRTEAQTANERGGP